MQSKSSRDDTHTPNSAVGSVHDGMEQVKVFRVLFHLKQRRRPTLSTHTDTISIALLSSCYALPLPILSHHDHHHQQHHWLALAVSGIYRSIVSKASRAIAVEPNADDKFSSTRTTGCTPPLLNGGHCSSQVSGWRQLYLQVCIIIIIIIGSELSSTKNL